MLKFRAAYSSIRSQIFHQLVLAKLIRVSGIKTIVKS